MSKLLQTDARAYRTCILYEVVSKTPVEEAFKRMQKARPSLNYLDFEYWYFRFLNGNYDLDHDKNTDPKNRELSDMPFEVAERFLEKLDATDRLSLRKVSRSLRIIVDRNKIHCESARLTFRAKNTDLSINNQLIKYKHSKKGFTDLKFDRFSKVTEGIHWQMAIKDFSTFFPNPNWTFKTLKIDFGAKTGRQGGRVPDGHEKIGENAQRLRLLQSILPSTNSRIHVEELEIVSVELTPVVALLPYFNPEVLKKLWISTEEVDMEEMEKIMEMDHWKTVEEVHFKNIPNLFDIQDLFRLKEFTIRNCQVTEERLAVVRDLLPQSPNISYCSLGFNCLPPHPYRRDYQLDDFSEEFLEAMGVENPLFDVDSGQYRVEGADHYFHMECNRNKDTISLDITKHTN